LGDDLVIAPYATIMALMVAPHAAYKNMKRLTREGFEGKYGYYEAVDYTSSRLPRGKSSIIIESFMVHHQGMAFLSLAYALLDKPMQKRFEAEPAFRAAMPLLHEKAPKTAILEIEENDKASAPGTMNDADPVSRYVSTPNTPIPQVQLLSNGRYHVMATNAGGSSSRWNNLAVTRYRVDGTRDNWGSFCYIRDVSRDKYWSASYQPVLGNPDFYESILSEGRVEYRRRDGDIETHTDIIVSPEDDVEIRRIRVKNLSRQKKTIEVTSYAEVVMAPQAADMAHPAFSNLFVQTEILSDKNALLCTRRARSENETPPWMCHFMSVRDAEIGAVSFETDRMKFIGRGNTTQNPAVMRATGPLSGTQGSVLDPVVAIRRVITIEPQQSAIIDIVTGAAETRDTCISMIDKYNDAVLSNRVFELAWSHNQVILRQLNTNEKDSQLFNRLASGILYANNPLRADASVVMRNRRGQSGLWGYSISGDYPILLLQVRSGDSLDLVRHLIQAHAYWRLKGLSVDLVIWNEDQGGYRQVLQDQIIGMITAGPESSQVDRPGGIFVRSAEHISPEDRVLFETVAKVILRDTDGSLEEQVSRLETKLPALPRLQITSGTKSAWPARKEDIQLPETILSNGIGGFTPDGKEYVIKSSRRDRTPAPWSNVIANPYFGTVISESGQSYTWSDNAHEYRLTPWMNDPVSDGSGEAFYIRDENNGFFWSPSPGAAPDGGDYITRHGFGYTTFEHVYDGIRTELTVYVAIDAPIKFSVIKIRNESGRRRKLSVTGYVEWVLGDIRSKTGMHIVTQVDKATGAILARNGYNPDFSERIAFFDVNDNARSFTCDRREFLGRNGNLTHPQALERARLSGAVGASMDSCAALQSVFEIADGEAKEIVFKLGIAGNRVDEASAFIRRYYGRGPARIAFEGVDQFWKNTLGTVQVQTPDPALNVLANGWLIYQTIACRLWARSGYYQSGGAFGFRDQLQDAMAVIHTKPEFLRAQILLCAEHQFIEGDVQHWWHPPQDRGVRTKCSDDYLWLPLAVCRYVAATGDTGILDEVRHFLEGRQLGPDEDSYYDLPLRSGEHADIYEHCVRALRHGMRLGEHGLPLIGSCDWNDGMDKVGEHGKGESVWLAFFIYDIMKQFAALAEMRKDAAMLAFCHESAETLKRSIDENAWDGAWYRRAYFDDGTPLGSASNEECQIDSLSQSWSILSGAADKTRAKNAMAEVDKRLVRRDAGLIQLLDPPFDKKGKNPGYIRGYVPGVRENGGQYTHAAIWTAMAFAKMGDGDKSYELFDLINPLNHARNIEDAKLYKVEPYVVAADVYGVAPHTGRGGWTWYTGSSGWMYRLLIESILGLGLAGDKIVVDPCLPAKWDRFAVDYKHMNTMYRIEIVRTGRKQVILNNEARDGNTIPLLKDGGTHSVVVEI
jgi:cellobiose phosphorylase